MAQIECRLIHGYTAFEEIVDLEIAVWDLDPRDAVPANLMHAMAANGSLVVGAYDHDQVVGMALAFPSHDGKKWMLWSHMAAVHPDYQSQGIGFILKQFQRTWALQHRYNTIGWTFDPLQRGNANFNLNRLGAISQIYHINFYGEMRDGINVGLPSDRLEVHWHLKDKQVAKLSQGIARKTTKSWDNIPKLVKLDNRGNPQTHENSNLDSDCYLVEIPGDLKGLKQEQPSLALEWRLALRKVLLESFNQGYRATDFIEIDQRCYYVLTRPEPWFLYVLECSDSTLYTGITPNISKRVITHNQGKGAAYTASRRPVRLLAAWRFSTRADATHAEVHFKKLPRQAKLNLIQQQIPYKDAPFVVNIDTFD